MRLRGVSKVYPGAGSAGEVTAVDGADLEILEGETLALVGESGCGKSSLLRLLNRMEEPTAGDLYFGDAELSTFEPTALRRRIGYVQQTGGLLPHWTVKRNVGLVPELLGWPKERRRSGPRSSCGSSACRQPPTPPATRVNSPAASGNGSPSPAPWPRIRRSSCWTSPSARSTRSPGPTCSRRSCGCGHRGSRRP